MWVSKKERNMLKMAPKKGKKSWTMPLKIQRGWAKRQQNFPKNDPKKCQKKVELCLLNHNVGEQKRQKNA